MLALKVVRDADKIGHFNVELNDRFDVWAEYDMEELKSVYGLSSRVQEAWNNHRTVNINDVETVTDRLCFLRAWIFDINFSESFEIIKDLGYLRDIYAAMDEWCGDNIILRDLFKKMHHESIAYANNRLNLGL